MVLHFENFFFPFVLFIFLILTSNLIHGQALDRKDTEFGLAFGAPIAGGKEIMGENTTIKYSSPILPVVYINRCFQDFSTLGLVATYGTFKYETKNPFQKWMGNDSLGNAIYKDTAVFRSGNGNILTLSLRYKFELGFWSAKWVPYLTLESPIKIRNTKVMGQNNSRSNFGISLGLFVGCAYHISKNLRANFEIGVGNLAMCHTGISYLIRRRKKRD